MTHHLGGGRREFLAHVETWRATSGVISLLKLLLAEGYEVTITADHGSIEARGIGRPSAGILEEVRTERVRLFESAELRGAPVFPEGCSYWIPPGLPPGICPVFAPPLAAFGQEGSISNCHGGLDPMEVVVPFVRLAPGQ